MAAFDQSFAVIGGMAGFLYAMAGMCISNYQNFAYENALHKRLYTQSKRKRNSGKKRTILEDEKGDGGSDDDDENKRAQKIEQELEENILNREPLYFSYGEYCTTRLLKMLCCCCSCFDSN